MQKECFGLVSTLGISPDSSSGGYNGLRFFKFKREVNIIDKIFGNFVIGQSYCRMLDLVHNFILVVINNNVGVISLEYFSPI